MEFTKDSNRIKLSKREIEVCNLLFHFLVPGFFAFLFYRNDWKKVWLIFLLTMKSLLGIFSLFFKKFSQSFLSLSEIFLINYVSVSISNQFGLFDLRSLEKTHVS